MVLPLNLPLYLTLFLIMLLSSLLSHYDSLPPSPSLSLSLSLSLCYIIMIGLMPDTKDVYNTYTLAHYKNSGLF